MGNMRKLAKITLGVILTCFILGNGKVASGKAFFMALAPDRCFRAVDAQDTKDTKDNANTNYGYISLEKIYDSDSYYVNARAVANPRADLNSDSNIYSNTVTTKQGEGKVTIVEEWKGKRMIRGNTYYLALRNSNATHNYRNASGQFGWY